jgi:hypothetical protein
VIRAHRRRHFWFWLALAVLAPALLVAAILARPDAPQNERLPAGATTFSEAGVP